MTVSYVPPFDLKRLVKRIAAMKAITIPLLRELSVVAECLCACGQYCESFELSYFITKRLEASYASMLSWRIKAAIDCARSCVTTEQCEYTVQLLERLIIWFESTAINDAAVIVLSIYLVDLYESQRPRSSQDHLNRVMKYVKGDHSNLPDLEPSCRFREHFALKYKLENNTLPIEVPFSVPGSQYMDSMLGDIDTANTTVLVLLNWCHSVLLEREEGLERVIGSGKLTPRRCVIVLFRDFIEVWLGSGPQSSTPSRFLREQTDRARCMLRKTLLSEIDALATLAWLITNEVSLKLGFYSDPNDTFMKPPKRSSTLRQSTIELINYGPAISHKFRDAYLSRISSSLAERRRQCIASEEHLSGVNCLDLGQRPSLTIIEEFLKLVSLSSSYTSSLLQLHTEAHPGLNIHITEPHVVKSLSHIPEDSPMPDPDQEGIETQPTLSRTSRRSSLSSGFRSLALRLGGNSGTALSISSKQTILSSKRTSVASLDSHESWRFSRATGMQSNTSLGDSDSTRGSILEDAMDTSWSGSSCSAL